MAFSKPTSYESGYVDKLLQENNSSKFYMEFQGCRFNHIQLGLIALDRVKAPKVRMNQFVEIYQKRLENTEGKSAIEQKSTETDPNKLFGSRKAYYTLVKYYTSKLHDEYGSDVEKLLNGEFPKLQRGMIGSAFHAIIQIGYGYAAKSSTAVCEGLAYLHHSFLPITLSDDTFLLGKGKSGILDVLEDVRLDATLQDFICHDESMKTCKNPSFNLIVNQLLTKKADTFAKYISQIKLPEMNTPNCTSEETEKLCRWFLDRVIHAYSTSEEKNAFYLLHCVTATWGLLQILIAMEDPHKALDAIQSAIICFLALYLVQGSPALTVPIDGATFKYSEWSEIIQAVHDGEELDEHVVKLVQVVHDLAEETNDDAKVLLYKAAANSALTNPFPAGGGPVTTILP